MNITYVEEPRHDDITGLIVSFEIDPEKQVGRARPYTTNEETIIWLDEAGNVLTVEVMMKARELYGADPVTVEGLPALVRTSPLEGVSSVEDFEKIRAEAEEWHRQTWRGGPYRRKEDGPAS